MKLAELEALKAQIAELEWLLERAKYDPKTWKARLSTYQEDGQLMLSLRLSPRTNRHVDLTCSDPHPGFEPPFVGTHHFYIEGNHYYDQFALSTLKSKLSERGDEDLE